MSQQTLPLIILIIVIIIIIIIIIIIHAFLSRPKVVTSETAVVVGLSGQTVGERGGTTFPIRFTRGNAIPLAYTTAVGGRAGTWRNAQNSVNCFSEKLLKLLPRECQISRLKCTISFVSWGTAPYPTGEITALPQVPN